MSWTWEELGPYFILTTFIIVTAIVAIALEMSARLQLVYTIDKKVRKAANPRLPPHDSFNICMAARIMFNLSVICILKRLIRCMFHSVLIIMGLIVGAILSSLQLLPDEEQGVGHEKLKQEHGITFPAYTPIMFFFGLLPPVILESSYSLYDVDFFSNIGTILLYACVGTLLNVFSIGPLLYSIYYLGLMGSMPLVSDVPDAALSVYNTTEPASLVSSSPYSFLTEPSWTESSADYLDNSSTSPANPMDTVATDLWSSNSTSGGLEPPQSLGLLETLVFATLVSAVDPVAVLAIFQETHIDRSLYFLVFGESLFNDAVTVGLYHTMLGFLESAVQVSAAKVLLCCLGLMAVGVVGMLIGIGYGLLSALLTKTTAHVRVYEPLLVLGLAYMSYLTSELLGFSGIISIIGCGLVQSHYALKNVSHKSFTTIKYFTKMMSAISESIIFLFLGMAVLTGNHLWHWLFITWTLILSLVCRFAVVFLLTWLMNHYRLRRLSPEEQFIMSYGGLRGAVCFSLVHMLDRRVVRTRSLFLTTALALIFCTVFLQGITLKPLISVFHIKRAADKHATCMITDINHNVCELMLAAVEQIAGCGGQFSLIRRLREWDRKLFQRYFLAPEVEPSMMRVYRRHYMLDMYARRPVALRQPVIDEETVERRTRRLSFSEQRTLRNALKTCRITGRPTSLMRHQIEDEDLLRNNLTTSTTLREHSQMLNADRLHEAMAQWNQGSGQQRYSDTML